MIDWNLAPEGAVALKQDVGKWRNVTWIHADGSWWDDDDATWNPGSAERDWVQTIAVRPVEQPKTVADAVAALSKEELTGKWEQIRYAPKQDYFFPDMNRDKWFDSVHVCTREEFEVYVKEQEGEKWTHVYCGEKCKVVGEPDSFGRVVILTESDTYFLDKPETLKPIKPTISESDAKALELFANKSHRHGVAWAVKEYLDGHEII